MGITEIKVESMDAQGFISDQVKAIADIVGYYFGSIRIMFVNLYFK